MITEFTLPQLLNITTGRLISGNFQDLYIVLSYLTDAKSFIGYNQLRGLAELVKPHILDYIPEIALLQTPDETDTDDVWFLWSEYITAKYTDTYTLPSAGVFNGY